MAEVKKLVSFGNLQSYDQLIKAYIGDSDAKIDAKSIKTVEVVGDAIYFFKTDSVPKTEEGSVDVSKAVKKVDIASSDVEALKEAVDKINGTGEGSLAKVLEEAKSDATTKAGQALTDAKAYADSLADNYDASGSADTALSSAKAYTDELKNGAVKTNTDAIAENKKVIDKLDGSDETEGSIKKQIKDAIAGVTSDADALETRVEANETAIAAINNTETGIAKVAADNLATAKTELEGKITEEATTARAAEQANAAAIAVLNGTGAGSVTKTVTDAIAKVVDDAPEAYDTLKEIAAWIAADDTRAADLVAKDTELQDAIDALETLVGTLPEGETKNVVTYLKDLISAEETRATGVESGLDTRIATVEAKFTGDESVDKKIENAVKVEADIARAAEKANADAITKEVADRNTAITTAVEALDAEVTQEGTVSAKVTEVDGKLTAVEVKIADETYDAYGSAQSVKDALDYEVASTTDINGLFSDLSN